MPELHSGFIIIRLVPQADPWADADIGDLRLLARARKLTDLERVLENYDQCTSSRLVSSATPSKTLELEEKAAAQGARPRRSLSSYWRLDARQVTDADKLVTELNRVDAVEIAYRELRGGNPEPPAAIPNDAFADQQFHLQPAPAGIDVHFVRTRPHGFGGLVRFVDLEQGWSFDHEDMPQTIAIPGASRDVRPTSRHHGTAVLGVVAGKENVVGIVGIAPQPLSVSVSSHFRADLDSGDHVVDAIEAVLDFLDAGDVLLVEWQDALNRPAEANPAIADAIEKAGNLGIVVVESAGNGNLDLDTVPSLNRNHAGFEDTGAIVVGACHAVLDSSGTAHDRWVHPDPSLSAGSNFGSRVDCHAFGEQVVTAGPPRTSTGLVGNGTTPTRQYRRDFGGTSAAAAIVAGAAVVVQGMHKAVKGVPLKPVEMRHVLASHGTSQGARPGNIGRMPDLKKIAMALQL